MTLNKKTTKSQVTHMVAVHGSDRLQFFVESNVIFGQIVRSAQDGRARFQC